MNSSDSASNQPNAGVQTSLDALLKIKGEARGFSFLPRQPVHSLLAGRHASRLRGRGLAFEELRQYVPGDDVRTIDWKATARLRSPYIRVYNEERERPVLLVVDQRASMFFGSRRVMKSVAAAEVAALAAWRTLDTGDRTGGVVFNDQEIVELRPHRSQSQVLRLLHEVVRMNQTLTKEPSRSLESTIELNQALEIALRRAQHDYLVVLISDLDGANEETRRLATQIAAHNDMLVIAIYDPLGASLQGQPGMVAHDRGTSYTIPESSGFADSFRREFSSLLKHWQDVFRALRIPVIPISTASRPVDQMRAFFGSHRAGRQ